MSFLTSSYSKVADNIADLSGLTAAKSSEPPKKSTRGNGVSPWAGRDALTVLLQSLVETIANKTAKNEAQEALDEHAKRSSIHEKSHQMMYDKLKTYDHDMKALRDENELLTAAVKQHEAKNAQAELENAALMAKVSTMGGVIDTERKEREGMNKKIGEVDKNLGDVAKKITANKGGGIEMKKHAIRAEKRERETNVIIRGMEYKGHDETQQEVEQAVLALLGTMTFPTEPKLRFATRLVNKKKARPASGTPPPMLISFDGMEHKKALFAGLPVWGRDHTQYKFSHDVPPSLKTEHDALEKSAYELRKAQPGTKTRVVIKDVTVILLSKPPGETKFLPVKANGADAPST